MFCRLDTLYSTVTEYGEISLFTRPYNIKYKTCILLRYWLINSVGEFGDELEQKKNLVIHP